MLISIDESVIDFIRENKEELNYCSKVIKSLNTIARAYADKEHFVIGDVYTLEYLCKCELLENTSKRMFTSISSQYVFIAGLQDRLNCKVVAHKKGNNFFKEGNEYWVPIDRFEKLRESYLVSEDLSDCGFYESLCKKMMRGKRNFDGVNLKFFPDSCSGNQADRTVTSLLQRGHEAFILLIVDTDKDHHESRPGPSFDEALKVYKKTKTSNVIKLHEMKLREKENLVPPSLFLLIENPPHEEILRFLSELEPYPEYENVLRYLDIKDGFKVGTYIGRGLYENVIKGLETENLLACSLTNDNNKTIFNGIGNKVLENKFQKQVLEGGLLSIIKEKEKLLEEGKEIPRNVLVELNYKYNKSKELFASLPTYIEEDWHQLCEDIVSWGCCPQNVKEVN
ncbi:hypothetical protein PRVXT_000330 [Proteinivorax tanatarense]|uniref:Uncharacterized protein n=1 Tax=Proteinivorax tanatarense TaxID=1260629 RepID=A0AAU7VMB8_9FIRM